MKLLIYQRIFIGSVYAKYYYDLRDLAISFRNLQLPPLGKERAARLEAQSRNYEGKLNLTHQSLTRSASAERQRLKESRAPAIIP